MLAVHQSLCSFLGSVGQFCLNDGASRKGNRDQPGRSRIVSRQGIAGEREEEDEENGKWSASLHAGILSASLVRVKPGAAWVVGLFEGAGSESLVSVILEMTKL